MTRPQPGRPDGVALITVLIVVAVVALVATGMASAFFLHLNRTGNILEADQAQEYARGAEEFAIQVLKKSFEQDKNVHLKQPWAVKGMAFPIDHGVLTGEITDLQACFNLNSLAASGNANAGGGGKDKNKPENVDRNEQQRRQDDQNQGPDERDALGQPLSSGQKIFQGLVRELRLDTEAPYQALREALSDWIDEDQNPSGPGGAEDVHYTGQRLPYRSADQLLASVTELRAVKGFGPRLYDKLRAYVCVLPDANQFALNVNTLAEERGELLVAMFKDGKLASGQAMDFLKQRPAKGYGAADLSKLPLKDLRVANSLTTESNYFLLRARAIVGRGEARLEAVIKREGSNYRVLSRHFGEENFHE